MQSGYVPLSPQPTEGEKSFCCRRRAKKVQAADITAAGHKYVTRADGRIIEYCTGGKEGGIPVYYAPGYGQSCDLLADYTKEIAKRHNLFVFCISMPGFGYSDSLPLGYKRSLLDWPADVALVMQAEGVQDLAVLGFSTGCIHAASVAHSFMDRILAVVLLTPTAPYKIEKEGGGIAKSTAFVKWAMQKPYLGDVLAMTLLKMSFKSQMASSAPDVHKAILKLEEQGGTDLKCAQELAQAGVFSGRHTYRGWCDNMHTIVDDIPFDLAKLGELTARGVQFGISTAPDDTTNPPAMQQWWKDQVPGSYLVSCNAGYGHFHGLTPSNMERVMTVLETAAGEQLKGKP